MTSIAKAGGRGWARGAWIVLAALALGGAEPTRAERLGAVVRNEDGDPVRDAVVYAVPLDAASEARPPAAEVEIDQVDKEFVPHVTAVRVGTHVSFPNRDQIRHHVYSFSEAKTFEIPLYKGTPAESVEFDEPGDVALGCNIHDWMRAYVFVSETPYFAVTDEGGSAVLELPAGGYRVEVWHPQLKGEPGATATRVRLAAGASEELRFSIGQKRAWRPRRAPSAGDPSYR